MQQLILAETSKISKVTKKVVSGIHFSSRTETPWHLTDGHRWSRAFSPMNHQWTTGGPPMPGATFWYGHRWTTGGHRWKWKSQKRPMRLKTLFSFVHTIQMVVLPLRSNAFPCMDHMIIKLNTLYMSTKKKTNILETINSIQIGQILFTFSALEELEFPLGWTT